MPAMTVATMEVPVEVVNALVWLFLAVMSVGFVVWVLVKGANPRPSVVRVYIAGTVSGNQKDSVVDQDYRQKIAFVLQPYSDVLVYDPLVGNEDSLLYNDKEARQMFEGCLERIRSKTDVVIAYIPEASMGTAIELYEAKKYGKFVIIISPLSDNWVVRLYGDMVFVSLDAFVDRVVRGGFDGILNARYNDFTGKPEIVARN